MISDADRASLLDEARSEVKRWGGSGVSLSHLAVVLERSWHDQFVTVFTENERSTLAAQRQAGRFTGSEADLITLLKNNDRIDVLRALRLALLSESDPGTSQVEPPPSARTPDPATDGAGPKDAPLPPHGGLHDGQTPHSQPPTAPGAEEVSVVAESTASAPVPGPSEGKNAQPDRVGTLAPDTNTQPSLNQSPTSWDRRSAGLVAELGIEPGTPLVGRVSEVAALTAALLREDRVPVVLSGPSGSGRSRVAAEAAARVRAQGGERCFQVRSDALGMDPAQALTWIVEDARDVGAVTLFLDHFDFLAALGTSNPNPVVLRLAAWAARRTGLRLVVVIEDRYAARVALHLEELHARAVHVDLGEMPPSEVQRIVTDLVGTRHTPVDIESAIRPRASTDYLGHPGLAVQRLDEARAVAASSASAPPPEEAAPTAPATSLAEQLKAKVKGQDEAIATVAQRLAITLSSLDLRPERPDGVFLFVGPTGVGKTELARSMASSLHGSVDNLIRLDMSEYAHDWAISRLTGPMPGYVGSTEPDSWLTTRISKRPASVVLLDEIEKAHPGVWNVFLQAFDSGRLTDSRGSTVDLSKTVFVMTSNLGVREAQKNQSGFGAVSGQPAVVESKIRAAVAEVMPPEFVGRLDEIVVFRSLSEESIREIAVSEIAAVLDRLRAAGWDVAVDADVVDFVAAQGYQPAMGARHLLRNIEKHLLGALAGADARRGTLRMVQGTVEFVSPASA